MNAMTSPLRSVSILLCTLVVPMGFAAEGDDAHTTKHQVTSDAAVTSGLNATLSPASLTFSTQAVGTTSAAETVALKNTGTTTLTISSIAITGTDHGDFAQTHTCKSSLAAGAACTIGVTFKPTASLTRTAALSVTDNAAGSPQKVSLSGIGTTARLSPTSMNFYPVSIGATSLARTVTLTNVGTTTLTISGIAITEANPRVFAQTHTCKSSLAAGASCTISVTFKPTSAGDLRGTLSVTANAPGTAPTVALNGIGVKPGQVKPWTWVSGAKTVKAKGIYGTRGIGAAGNVPGARDRSVSWIDSAEDLWLFGGYGYDSAGTTGDLNDLWRYSPGSGEWTWVSGSNTAGAKGVYGTKGIAAAGNVPGARDSSVSWTDRAGDLWLFGGVGLNDLWRYSPGSGEWTWVSGSSTAGAKGVYGTQGIPAAGNVPGARDRSVSWIDSAGDLWLFGGSGYDSAGTLGFLNDLWRYSPGSGQWTWVGGSRTVNAEGVYGTLGTATAGNVPGARIGSVSWIDSAGDLWLFGGLGYDSIRDWGFLNDLWRYSPGTRQWTWVSGSSKLEDEKAVYGTLGIAAPGNVPGGRISSVSWTDSAGNLWLFGGRQGFAFANDLWRYGAGTGEWTWVSGSSTTGAKGVYGTLGIAEAGNVPGARFAALAWIDSAGSLWLFGGVGSDSADMPGDLNDLWVY